MSEEKTTAEFLVVNTVLLTADKFIELSAYSAMLTAIKKLIRGKYVTADDIRKILGVAKDEDE